MGSETNEASCCVSPRSAKVELLVGVKQELCVVGQLPERN